MVDVSNFVFFTNLGKNRFFKSVIYKILPDVKNMEWQICYTDNLIDELLEDKEFKEFIFLMNKINNNYITVQKVDSEYSVAKIKSDFANYYNGNRKWFVNLDDDMIVSYDSLRALEVIDLSLEDYDMFLLTQFDVYNGRKFDDWNDDYIIYEKDTLENFKKNIGEQFIAHHLWGSNEGVLFINVDKTMSSFYAVKFKTLKRKDIYEAMQGFEKFLRGYDVKIAMMIKRKAFIIPSLAYHLGCYDLYYNENWKNGIKYLEIKNKWMEK